MQLKQYQKNKLIIWITQQFGIRKRNSIKNKSSIYSKIIKTLKNNKFIYFLMEFIKGKELFEVICDIGLLNKLETQFY